MKHYFTGPAHIIIGIIIIVIALLLWGGKAWAPQDVKDVSPVITTPETSQ